MRDDDNGLPHPLEIVDLRDQLFHFLRDQNRGWLVQDQNLDLAIEHFQDLHALAGADGQVAYLVVRIQAEIIFLDQVLHDFAFPLVVDQWQVDLFVSDF